MKNLSQTQKFYSETYKTEAARKVNEAWVRKLKSKIYIPFSPNKKVLDVACGVSTLGNIFGGQVYGMDINPQAVSTAKKNGIKAVVGDVEKKWKFPEGYFDIVIASHIIEHVVNTDHLILEAKRVLKKDGLLIVATPNLAAWFNRILLLFGFQPFFTEVSTIDKTLGLKFTRKITPNRNPLGHLRLFTLNSLEDIINMHGFKIIKISSVEFEYFPFVFGFLDKIISKNASFASNIIMVGRKN